MSNSVIVWLDDSARRTNWARILAPRTVADVKAEAPPEIRHSRVQVIGYEIRDGVPRVAFYTTPSMGRGYRLADILCGELYDQPD